MMSFLLWLLLGKPSPRELKEAEEIREMYRQADEKGLEIVIDRSGIYKRKKLG